MNIQIQLIGELGDATMAQVLTVLAGPTAKAPVAKASPAPKAAEAAEDTQEEKPVKPAAKPAAKAPAPKPAAKAPAPKPAAEAEEDFSELDADAQLEAIKKEVTKHTKKGKTADIKQLLGIYGVAKASDLDPETFEAFYDLVKRYSAGESAEDIVESEAV